VVSSCGHHERENRLIKTSVGRRQEPARAAPGVPAAEHSDETGWKRQERPQRNQRSAANILRLAKGAWEVNYLAESADSEELGEQELRGLPVLLLR